MIKKISKLGLTLSLFTPTLILAQASLANSTFRDLIMSAVGSLKILLPVMYTCAFIVLFWGLSRIILNSGNSAQATAGRNYIFWAVIAIFCLLAVNGIITFVMATFGASFNSDPAGLYLPT